MKQECEECGNRFTLGVQGGTVQFEDGSEKMLCDYCNKSQLNEIREQIKEKYNINL